MTGGCILRHVVTLTGHQSSSVMEEHELILVAVYVCMDPLGSQSTGEINEASSQQTSPSAPMETAFRPGWAGLGAGAGRGKNWTLGNMMERRNLDIVPLLLGAPESGPKIGCFGFCCYQSVSNNTPRLFVTRCLQRRTFA